MACFSTVIFLKTKMLIDDVFYLDPLGFLDFTESSSLLLSAASSMSHEVRDKGMITYDSRRCFLRGLS